MIFFGQDGKAVGTSDGEWLFDEKGNPICYIMDGQLHTLDGHFVGRIFGKLVRSADATLLAFAEGAKMTLAPAKPKILNVLVPRLRPLGLDVSTESTDERPSFLSLSHLCVSFADLSEPSK